eukprot:7921151-Pyramimonas_sp.AAC.1
MNIITHYLTPSRHTHTAGCSPAEQSSTSDISSHLRAAPDPWYALIYAGELGPDGCIYGVPGSARSVLRIQPVVGAAPNAPNGTPERHLGYKVSLVGSCCGPSVQSSMGKNRFKWLRGALCRDGCIYGIPSNADCVLRIVLPPGGYSP